MFDALCALLASLLYSIAALKMLVQSHKTNTFEMCSTMAVVLTACGCLFVYMRTRMRSWALRREVR